MDKWLLLGGDDRRPLGGHPREITEFTVQPGDSGKAEKRGRFYVKYGFDADGNLVSRDTYINDSLAMKSKATYDSDGMQEVFTSVKTGESTRIYSRRLSDGAYKTVFIHLKTPSTSSITSYLPDGNQVIREEYSDTTARNMPTSQAHIYYEGNRITKVTGVSGANSVEELMFYSKWDTPDSIQMFGGKGTRNLLERVYYEINDHGDPTRLVRMVGKDTSAVETYEYVYDRHGNWTRETTRALKVNGPGNYRGDRGRPGSQPSVTERVIGY